MGVASQNSTLPCAIATFPVSLPLSSPGDFWPRLPLLPSTRPWTSAHPPWPPQPKPQPLTPSFSNSPLSLQRLERSAYVFALLHGWIDVRLTSSAVVCKDWNVLPMCLCYYVNDLRSSNYLNYSSFRDAYTLSEQAAWQEKITVRRWAVKKVNQSTQNAKLLFLTFNVLVTHPRKLLFTMANPATRGLQKKEKRTKKRRGSLEAPPPAPRC